MDAVALFVDFDDVYASISKKSLPISSGLLAQSLRRTARALGSPLKPYACADWSRYPQLSDPSGRLLPSAREAFEREGFEALASTSRHETQWRMEERIFRLIYDEASPPRTFVLVTNDGQFASTAERIRSLSYQIRLWVVGDDVPAQLTSLGVAITPLEELLDLQDKSVAPAKTLALFVDLENIVIGLNSLGYLVDPGVLAGSLRERAQRQGSLVEAYAYADWQKLPPAFDGGGRNLMAEAQRTFELSSIETRYLISIAGKNTADMRMADDIRDLLEGKNQPDVFIIASGDRDFTPIIDTLVRAHKKVVVWGVEGCTSASLARVAQVEFIQSFVPLLRRGQNQPLAIGERVQPGAVASPEPDGQEDEGEVRPTIWTKLVMVLDDLMKRNNWKWVSLSRATGELAKLKEFGPTEEDARYALNQAVARGIVLKERIQNPNPNYPDQFVWAFRPREDSAVVRAARLLPERIIEIMKYGLGRMEYVAFSYLQAQLARDRTLIQFYNDLDEEGRTHWINFLISEGLIYASRRPHHRNPGDLVTALTLPSATGASFRQFGEVVVSGLSRDNGSDGSAGDLAEQDHRDTGMWKRLVISIDNFIARSGMEWAPLITLRQRLSLFGREDMEAVLRGGQEAGEVVIQEYPNPNKPYPTKGASLNVDSPAVQAVLEERDNLLSSLVRFQDAGKDITGLAVREALVEVSPASDELSSLWLSILVGERMLTCGPAVSGQPRTYRLNLDHPVLRRVNGSDEASPAEATSLDCEPSEGQAGRSVTSLQQA